MRGTCGRCTCKSRQLSPRRTRGSAAVPGRVRAACPRGTAPALRLGQGQRHPHGRERAMAGIPGPAGHAVLEVPPPVIGSVVWQSNLTGKTKGSSPGLQHGLAQSVQSGYFIVQLPGTSCVRAHRAPESRSAAAAQLPASSRHSHSSATAAAAGARGSPGFGTRPPVAGSKIAQTRRHSVPVRVCSSFTGGLEPNPPPQESACLAACPPLPAHRNCGTALPVTILTRPLQTCSVVARPQRGAAGCSGQPTHTATPRHKPSKAKGQGKPHDCATGSGLLSLPNSHEPFCSRSNTESLLLLHSRCPGATHGR